MTEQPDAAGPPRRDPDVRFLLANERTLLAWLRTGLALQGGGLVVFQLATRIDTREAIGVALLAAGAVCDVVGWWRYHAADRAIREDRLPARGVAPDLLALVLVAASVALAVVLLV